MNTPDRQAVDQRSRCDRDWNSLESLFAIIKERPSKNSRAHLPSHVAVRYSNDDICSDTQHDYIGQQEAIIRFSISILCFRLFFTATSSHLMIVSVLLLSLSFARSFSFPPLCVSPSLFLSLSVSEQQKQLRCQQTHSPTTEPWKSTAVYSSNAFSPFFSLIVDSLRFSSPSFLRLRSSSGVSTALKPSFASS